MFLVVGVSMIITMSMRMLCVCGVLVCTNVCVCVSVLSCGIRVVFAYKYYTHILCFSLSTKSTFWHQSLNVEVFNTRMTTAMTSLYTDCLCYLPALVDACNFIYLIDVLLINLC